MILNTKLIFLLYNIRRFNFNFKRLEEKMENKQMNETIQKGTPNNVTNALTDYRLPNNSPLISFKKKARITSILAIVFSFIMLVLRAITFNANMSKIAEYTLSGLAFTFFCVGFFIFFIALVFWILANLLIAYKRS